MTPVAKQYFSDLYLQKAPTYISLMTTKGTFSTARFGLDGIKPWKTVTH